MENALPPLYARWMKELSGGASFTSEPRSTCSNCTMTRTHEISSPLDLQFHPNLKCCTYNPGIPNYLVGSILLDTDSEFAEGRARFERMAPQQSVEPMGVGPTDFYRIFYSCKPFGQLEELVCPYFIARDGGLCGIWRHRNATCATWFCTFERGKTGYNFWQAMRTFLREVEKQLAYWCILQLDLVIPECPAGPRDGIWGNWMGREREFYQECYGLVSELPAGKVVEIAGVRAGDLWRDFREARSKMEAGNTPASLVFRPCRTWTLGNGFTRIWSYSKHDPLDLSDQIFGVLPAFDGRPTRQVIAEIQTEAGLRIEQILLQKLVDTRILVDPSTPPEQEGLV